MWHQTVRSWRPLVIALLALGAWSTVAPPAARAQELPPTVAAVIDYQRILREAEAAKSIREQIESRRNAYQDEISDEEERLREADQAFAKQSSVMSPEARAEKRREFEKEVVEVQRLVQERRNALDKASAVALNEVKKVLIEIVTGMADERGFNLVLPSSEVLFFARKIDLTEDVLAELDARLPHVEVPEVTAAEQ